MGKLLNFALGMIVGMAKQQSIINQNSKRHSNLNSNIPANNKPNIEVKRCQKCKLTLNKNAKKCYKCGHKFFSISNASSKHSKKITKPAKKFNREIKRCPKCNLTVNINAKKCFRCGHRFKLI